MKLMGGTFSEYDVSIIRNIMKKIEENYDFDNQLEALSPQEKYVYIGICSGVNAVVTMAENSLKERSAEILNEIFGQDIFEWTVPNTEDNSESEEDEEAIKTIQENPEIMENVLVNAVVEKVMKNTEEN